MKRIGVILCLAALALAARFGHAQTETPPFATGIVFHDRNRNGVRDTGEEGLKDIRVSNQSEIVKTDREGRYRLPIDDDTILFVIKPRGWMTPVDENKLPRFYYVHKPKGSPKSRHAGVAPTGPLPASVDFPLHPQKEPDRFRAILFGDTQPRNQQEIDYIAHDVVEGLIGADVSLGITLGDVVFDDLSLFGSLNRTIALIGVPWYNVLGNHDINQDAADDKHSDETWERVYGPSYYAFEHGPVHFLVLDDVVWTGATAAGERRYKGGLGPKQMAFIKNDLALIPKDQLVVLMMHIPLTNVEDRQELYRLIEQRPFALSLSAHTHNQQHRFLTKEDGWNGPQPHHHVVHVTVCGSWWSGAPDENGIPHATMNDGAPNGHSILTFDGQKYALEFKAARRPADHQMNIYAPEEVAASEADKTEVLVNVFAGSERSKVEMRLGESGAWVPMTRTAREDPYFAALKQAEAGPNPPPGRRLPNALLSPHLWQANLPADPPKGTHLIHVRTTDMFGKIYTDKRILRVR